jgi:hypothetical protein
MDAKERLIRFKDLLRILGREHSLESSDYRTAVLQESWTLLELLGTIEGFISDERLGIAGEDQRKLDAAKGVLRSWMNAAKQGMLSPQQAQQLSRNVTMIIARTTQSLDQMLTALDAERKDTGRLTSAYAAKSVPWYQNVMRAAVLSIAPLIAGCTPGQNARAEEPTPVITNTQERDYVKELDAKLAQVKIEEGKTAEEYHQTGSAEFEGNKNYLRVIAYERRAMQMNPDNPAYAVTLASGLCLSAVQEMDENYRIYLLRESVSQNEGARKMVNQSSRTPIQKKRYFALIDEGEGVAFYYLGEKDKAKKLLASAAAVKELQPLPKKIFDSM